MSRFVVHRHNGVSEIVRSETIEVSDVGPSQWVGYAVVREDGWPMCPKCGDDELYSLDVPATVDSIVGCYACAWTPAEQADGGWLRANAARNK